MQIAAVVIVIAFTSLPWIAVHIMPDIFTPVLYLSAVLFLTSNKNTELILYAFVFYVSTLIHNSHFIIALLCSSVMIAVACLVKRFNLFLKKSVVLTSIACVAVVSICSIHFIKGFGFVPSRGSHVFIVGKLSESGVLKAYLNDNCKQNDSGLCKFKENLPATGWQFLWDYDGPLYKTGGWDSSKTAYNAIIKGVFSNSYYRNAFIKHSLQATVKQMSYINIKGNVTCPMGDNNVREIFVRAYPSDTASYFRGKQHMKAIETDNYSIVYTCTFLLCLLLLPVCIYIVRRQDEVMMIIISALVFIIINAFVTATFANVLDRLQYRIAWIVPCVVIYSIISIYERRSMSGKQYL
ncbi:hypothetical protein CAP35_02945 [Chitinophagaceae bacterium IBVUCB1]|nr:hypothetical protein CAP35_02945 [Chitinophagaceae bacterium IBVUCB1]